MFKGISKFNSEVKSELQKCSWPWDPKEKGVKRYRELIDSTIVVLVAMVLLGGFVAFSDLILMNVMDLILQGVRSVRGS